MKKSGNVRRRLTSVIALAAIATGGVAGVADPLGVSTASAAAVNIRLMNINDFHGRIDANTVKFAGTVEQVRAAAPGGVNSVLFGAAGDLVGASLFASAVQNDDPTIDVLNALKLDSSSVGNHEFDKGLTDLTTHLEPRANWTYLCANCYQKGTTTPALPEYTVFTIGTVTVGYIGAVTQETPSLVSPSGVATLDFGDPVAAVNRVATQLSDGNAANGEAQVLVAEFHEGAPVSPAGPTFDDPAALTTALANPTFANIANNTSTLVDVIFNGHTHRAYRFVAPAPGAGGAARPIVQTGQYGENVGYVDLVVDDATGLVTSATSALVPRTAVADATLTATFPRVAQVKTIVDAALLNANAVGSTPVGSVTADITTSWKSGSYVNGVFTSPTQADRDDRSRESTLGHLVADSLLSSLSSPERGGAEIAVVNPGGLRAELLFGPDGVITYSEANAVLPFVNNLNTITLTGAQVKTMLEQQWQRTSAGAVPSAPYLQLGTSKNFTYTYDPTLAEGSRITSILINGAPIDPARNYRVGTFSFLIEGGDNFHVFRQGTDRRDSGLVDREAWIAYIQANSPLSPDFGRRAVQVSPWPATATPGQKLTFTVSDLDLRSLGSPQNTELDVYVGGVRIAQVPVVNGVAAVDVTVPASLPTAARNVILHAKPSGTMVNQRTLNPIEPQRLFDTRGPTESANAKRAVPVAKVGGANVLVVKATDLAGFIPSTGVSAVSLNVAVDQPDADGFVTVYDCGTRQLVANVNYVRNETVSNAVIAPVSKDGNICFYSLVPTHIVVDVNGWLSSGFTGVQPNRVFDTRAGESTNALRAVPKSRISGDPALDVQLTDLGTAGSLVPGANVGAVSLNVAITNPARAGFLSVYPCGQPRALIANVNFVANQTVSNSVVIPVSSTGRVCFYSPVPTDVVVDINGWFAASSAFRGVTPARVADTRGPAESPNALVTVPTVKVGPTNVLEVKVTGLANTTPASGVGSVALNVAVTNPLFPGFVTVYPCGNRPFTANVNYTMGETVSNAVIAPVSSAGTICIYSLHLTDIVVDINGYFMS